MAGGAGGAEPELEPSDFDPHRDFYGVWRRKIRAVPTGAVGRRLHGLRSGGYVRRRMENYAMRTGTDDSNGYLRGMGVGCRCCLSRFTLFVYGVARWKMIIKSLRATAPLSTDVVRGAGDGARG